MMHIKTPAADLRKFLDGHQLETTLPQRAVFIFVFSIEYRQTNNNKKLGEYNKNGMDR
jgi:hypothetical protein